MELNTLNNINKHLLKIGQTIDKRIKPISGLEELTQIRDEFFELHTGKYGYVAIWLDNKGELETIEYYPFSESTYSYTEE